MNPLSPFAYYRRHKQRALLLVSLITMATLGINLMVGMMHPILDHLSIVTIGPLSHVSLAYSSVSRSLEPTVVSQIRAHPDAADMIPENGLGLAVMVPSLAASAASRVLGVSAADLPVLLEACDLQLKEGELIQPRTAQVLFSEEIATALGLHVGDLIGRSINEQHYSDIPTPLTVVGILESKHSDLAQRAPVIIVSYEYLESHELYAPRQSGWIIIPQEGRQAALDSFLETTIRSPQTNVETYEQSAELALNVRRVMNLALSVVDGLVAIIIALVVGMIQQIALAQRLADLGVLHAIGHHKNRLVRLLTMETAIVAGVAWLLGLALSWPALAWLKTSFYEPRGVELVLTNLAPLWFSTPIPLVVVGFAVISLLRVFSRLDAVTIVERGKLSTEAGNPRWTTKRSSVRSLSSWTYYLRHHRRGLMLVAIMGLMVVGVAFPAFFLSPMVEAQRPFFLNHLRYVGEIRPGVGRSVDPGVVGQVRSHPAVEQVIPTQVLNVSISIPPASLAMVPIYGVSEDHLLVLIELLGMHLAEGQFPQPGSNEIILSREIALNRDLHIGDMVGRSANDRDIDIPTELVVVGILDQSSQQMFSNSAISLGFVSYEFLTQHELYAARPVRLLVIPVEGHKAELDRWLEEDISTSQTLVTTYNMRFRDIQQSTRNMLLLITAFECVIAIVAAVAMAALNHIFFTQRREEFGVLHAVGRNRSWLLLRTIRETASVVALAWLIGAMMCMASLIYAQANIYAPMGLRIDLFNLSSWLFTLPLPVAVIAASTGTVGRMLARLDPVSIVERR